MKRAAGNHAPWRVVIPAVAAVCITALAGISWQACEAAEPFVRPVAAVTSQPCAAHPLTAPRLAPVATHARSSPKTVAKPGKRNQPIHAPDPPKLLPLKPPNGRPAVITTLALADFGNLPVARRNLIESALAVARNFPWLPYVYGGADPALGGMDCSGAMYYVMIQTGLSPPRTSAGQYLWLRDHQRLHLIPSDALTTDHPSLAWLQPADLLFWSTPLIIDGASIVNITHVAMYLGHEKIDGLQVMINSTDGRSYRGIRSNGYGVYDFRLPPATSASKLVGYGTPPGIRVTLPTAPVRP